MDLARSKRHRASAKVAKLGANLELFLQKCYDSGAWGPALDRVMPEGHLRTLAEVAPENKGRMSSSQRVFTRSDDTAHLSPSADHTKASVRGEWVVSEPRGRCSPQVASEHRSAQL